MLPAETLSVREILRCLNTLRAYVQTNTQRHEIISGGIGTHASKETGA